MGWRQWFGAKTHTTDDLIAEAEAARAATQPTKPPSAQAPATSPNAEIADLLRRGKKIEAVKVYRAAYGTGLKEALDAVEAIAAGKSPAKPSAAKPQASDERVVALIAEGKKIDAIKEYRAVHGVGLKEAKDAVDLLAARRASGGTQA